MSIRTTFAGVKLATLHDLLGSGNAGVAEAVRAALLEDFSEDEIADGSGDVVDPLLAAAVVDRAVMEGVPQRGLGREGYEQVLAAERLAAQGQELLMTNFEVKHFFWDELLDWCDGHLALSPRERELMEWLMEGRPLFGRASTNMVTGYAFLTRTEAAELRALFQRIADAGMPEADELLLDEDDGAIPALDQIEAAGLDLMIAWS